MFFFDKTNMKNAQRASFKIGLRVCIYNFLIPSFTGFSLSRALFLQFKVYFEFIEVV